MRALVLLLGAIACDGPPLAVSDAGADAGAPQANDAGRDAGDERYDASFGGSQIPTDPTEALLDPERPSLPHECEGETLRPDELVERFYPGPDTVAGSSLPSRSSRLATDDAVRRCSAADNGPSSRHTISDSRSRCG